jgi:ATP-binding cassette subfamily F protein 3
MLAVTNLTKSYGARTLFANVSFNLTARDRLGIIGANGSGKTTLIEILAGNIEYDSGNVFLQKGASIGYLEQSTAFDPKNDLLAEVTGVNSSTHRLEHKRKLIHDSLAETTDPVEQSLLLRELGEIEAHYEHTGGYTIEFEARKILVGLGFSEKDFHRSSGEFSGGWLMRAGMAKLLLIEPDLLFLDEPTNHLDLDALVWLEKFLNDYAGAVILISHDRTFLNRMATKILAIERGRAKFYHGNYDAYVLQKEKEQEIHEATIKNQERFIESEMRFINRFRAKNTKATQVQSRLKRLEKIEVLTAERKEKTVRVSIPPSPRSGKEVVLLDRISFGYDSVPFYHNLSLTLVRGDKVALVGPNGAGKTTLLKLLAGKLTPNSGKHSFGHNVQPVYYAQHQSEQLIDDNTVLAEMRRAAIDETDEQLRTRLGAFLFSGDDVTKKVSTLSGGERARLSLAKLFLHPVNFILMDEPTNHLDIASRDMLAEALSEYDGSLCLVTHDRDLIDKIATKIIEVINGVIAVYHGNYSDYWGKKQDEDKTSLKSATPDQESYIPLSKRDIDKDRKRREGELRNRFHRESKKIKNRLAKIEDEAKSIERRIREIEEILSSPLNCEDRKVFNETLNEYEILKNRRELLDDEWIKLSLEIDRLRENVFGTTG